MQKEEEHIKVNIPSARVEQTVCSGCRNQSAAAHVQKPKSMKMTTKGKEQRAKSAECREQRTETKKKRQQQQLQRGTAKNDIRRLRQPLKSEIESGRGRGDCNKWHKLHNLHKAAAKTLKTLTANGQKRIVKCVAFLAQQQQQKQ